jgi:chromosome segregation and condensation protein ScpB
VEVEGPQDPELYSEVPTLITATQIRETMDELAAELRVADEGLLLIEGNAGYRLVTHPRFARWIRILAPGAAAGEAQPVSDRDLGGDFLPSTGDTR